MQKVVDSHNIYTYISRERVRERVLGGDVESARGNRNAIPENDGDRVLYVHELLAVIGVQNGFSGTVSDPLCEFS